MSDPMTFADFLTDFNEKYLKFQQDFIDACEDIVDMLNDAAGSFGEFIDDILPGGGAVDQAIDKWNDEINPSLGEAFTEIQTNVNDAVNDLVGSPLDLQRWAEAYAGARSDIYKQRGFGETAAAVQGAVVGPGVRQVQGGRRRAEPRVRRPRQRPHRRRQARRVPPPTRSSPCGAS